ncbi:MAG: flagellar hook-basal body complex protein FliE [Desulfocapsa sp.]|nr:flagellar hook-basal body complex protein FliE [Desulfocapsa sp.]
MNSNIGSIGSNPLPLQPADTNPIVKAKSDFSKVIQSTINQAVTAEHQSDKAIADLQSGDASSLHEVMISVEKADISLKMLVQFRNKAMQAYEEVMRMQI